MSTALTDRGHIPVLDGWRAISILLVLAGHLLPLGPAALQLNAAAAAMGMALFFTLSGFLIVTFLYGGMPVGRFVIKRLARIVPLAWTAMLALALWQQPNAMTLARNLSFTSNLPPADLMMHGEHLWSLCVEMQFYLLAAALVSFAGRRGLLAVPILCVIVTVARIYAHETISIVTWHRVDEILAGGVLALLYANARHFFLGKIPFVLAAAFLILCSHPQAGALQYLRPYAAAMLVGVTLSRVPAQVGRLLTSRVMAYIATVSYALYVIHNILAGTWLGTGATIEKYLKRPLLLAATFLLAHGSTFFFERPILALANRTRKSQIQVREEWAIGKS
jgi:peptidoglycan/LPS O-acetylase OafA/YrhL